MMSIKFVTLIISDEPMNLNHIKKCESVSHFIQKGVEVKSVLGEYSAPGFSVNESLSTQTINNCDVPFYGEGKKVSIAIADWLLEVVKSQLYDPLRNRRARENESQRKDRVIVNAFGRFIAEMPDCAKSDFEFRFPEISEKVIVQHGFMDDKISIGTVKFISKEEKKVVITIHDNPDYDNVYTHNAGSSHWECIKGIYKIEGGSNIIAYPKDDGIPLSSFLFIAPPTDAAKKMADSIYLERLRRIFPGGQASSL